MGNTLLRMARVLRMAPTWAGGEPEPAPQAAAQGMGGEAGLADEDSVLLHTLRGTTEE
jgi:hypothetical protein